MFYDGINGRVYSGANQVLEVRNASYAETVQNTPVPAMGEANERYSLGQVGASGQLTVNYDATDTTGQGTLISGTEVELHLYPNGNTSGEPDINGTVKITGRTLDMDQADAPQSTFDWVGVMSWDTVSP